MSENNYYNNNNNNNNNGQQERIISDKQYIGVYDGHNGDWAASYAKEKMHTHLKKCSFILSSIAAGSCATTRNLNSLNSA